MDSLPLVTVIVPCYNHKKYVEQCILSILNQTYKNIQLIVIDDGSKDNSFEIISQLSSKYDFHAESQQNMGLTKTLNKAITKYSKGKYIICIASDDYMHPKRIEHQVQFFESNQDLGFVFAKASIVNDDQVILGELPKKTPVPQCTLENLLMIGCYIPAATVIIKSEVFEKVGLYDENIFIEDWDMWLRIAERYPFAFMDETAAYYRSHGNNISFNYEKMIPAKKSILNKWKTHPLFNKALDKVLLEEIAIQSVLNKPKALTLMLKQIYLSKYLSYYKSIIKLFIKFKLKNSF